MKRLPAQPIQFTSDVVIDIPDIAPVGIVFSGGADSTMVLYKIISQCNNPINLYTIAVKDRGLSHAKVCMNLVEWFSAEFPNQIQLNINIKNTSQEGIQSLFDEPSFALRSGKVSAIFTGVSANPPESDHRVFKHYAHAVESELRNPEVIRNVKRGRMWYNPFTNTNKQQIVAEYIRHDLMETLFPLTRSCTQGANLNHCGVCWFCEERAWAEQINNANP
jgi:7-cyano-7-deazaguanine synthase in queuosine biosynthesis